MWYIFRNSDWHALERWNYQRRRDESVDAVCVQYNHTVWCIEHERQCNNYFEKWRDPSSLESIDVVN